MSAMILTPCCLLSPLCASRAAVTTATVVIVQMQTADRARSELACVQDVGWDKGTVRAEDDNFFYAKRKRKSTIANRIFCTRHSTVSSLLAIGLCVVLRGRWCNVIVLNVHVSSEEKSDDSKTVFLRNYSRLLIIFLSNV